ncbi:hypothetical protein E4U21_007467 [Claviceps maximensis]|nr:hypothetical protein E4U21_007467 [Claviceps maximensis]
MSNQDIRLRLAVRRHDFPEVKFVWPCKRSADLTIAKLLVSVNEVVPLESGEWGLEDYAVELVGADGDSYECLHFQSVAQTLKDEDQLIIRSLSTDDVRRRRMSGRHQISVDGRHLFDGVAFGRPWLRAPQGRPAIELPPRKRARIEAHEMEVATPGPEQMLMLEAPPQNDNDESDGDGDDDTEWTPKQPRNIANESSQHEENDASTSDCSDSDEEHLDCSREELDAEIKALRDAGSADKYDDSDTNECSLEHLAAIRMAYPLLSFATLEKELLKQKQNLRKTYDALQQSTSPSLSFDDMMDRMVMGILDQSESPPLQERPPADVLLNRRSPSQRPLIEEVVSDGAPDSSSSDVTSSDDESSSDSSSEDGDDGNDNGDGGDDDDDEDDDDEDESSFHGDDVSSSEESSDDSSDGSSDESSSDSSAEAVSEPAKVSVNGRIRQDSAPLQGLSRTQKRNARRRKQKAMTRETTSTMSLKDYELRALKEALLGALPADVGDAASQEPSPAKPGAALSTPSDDQNATATTTAQTSAQRRARVDMGAGRRMLFGALGLKNPKSKEDEECIRQELLKGVKPLHNFRIVEVGDDDGSKQATLENDDPNAWKSKITYRAVECCHEGMELSQPPFPFVQRWDPQQQYGSMRKRKRKAELLDDADGYEPSPSNVKKSTKDDPLKGNASGLVDAEDANLAEKTTFICNGTKGRAEACGADETEDLPELPEDPSTLPALEKGAAKEGMVITWKQCIMSKATQWQPVMASLTGEVLPRPPHEPGDTIHVRLAFRDRDYKEKLYDERTGQRIYDKFDTPDFEDEDEEDADDGARILTWVEMAEPRILAVTSPWIGKEE